MGASQRSERVNGGASGLPLLQQRVVVEVDEDGQREEKWRSGRKELARELTAALLGAAQWFWRGLRVRRWLFQRTMWAHQQHSSQVHFR